MGRAMVSGRSFSVASESRIMGTAPGGRGSSAHPSPAADVVAYVPSSRLKCGPAFAAVRFSVQNASFQARMKFRRMVEAMPGNETFFPGSYYYEKGPGLQRAGD